MRFPSLKCLRKTLSFALLLISCVAGAESGPARVLRDYSDTENCTPFPVPTFYLQNTNARALAMGDFNGDGVPDFAVWTETSGPSFTILLGARNGKFTAGNTYSIGTNSVGSPLAVGDLNGDGRLDVIAANGSDLVVFLGKGDGTFKSPLTAALANIEAIAVGDFNQDGKLDLAIGSDTDETHVQILIGNGDGTFKAPVKYPITLSPDAVATADLNHDGHLDLIVANGFSDTVSVLLGKGDGTFGPKADYQVGRGPYAVTSIDLNGDGYADIATADIDGTTAVLLNNGDGIFINTPVYGAAGPVGQAFGISAGPLETGSKPSLAVATTSGTYILVNNGDGTFKAGQGYEPPSSSVVLADFDGDGKTDLAVAGAYVGQGGSPGVSIISGQGGGGFDSNTAYIANTFLTEITLGDFYQDGILDIAAIGSDARPLALVRGEGEGVFAPPVFMRSGPSAPDISVDRFAVAAGDFNGDGKTDLVVVAGPVSPRSLQILLGDGQGGFTFHATYVVGSGYSAEITLGDFNNDGVTDIAVSYTDGVKILLGNGDGTFRVTSSFAANGNSIRLVAMDFNGDGKLDLAVANTDTSKVSIYLGAGDGTFLNTANFSVTFKPSSIAAADFNGDGKADLVVGVANRADATGEVQILLGGGDGSFKVGATTTGFWAPAPADFDGDGNTDLAAVNSQGFVQMLYGNGDGTFVSGGVTNIGQDTEFLTVADLNGDLAPDLLVPNDGGGEVSILLNRCGGQYLAWPKSGTHF